MLYALSKLIPVPMRSTVQDADGRTLHCRWVQWRDRCFATRWVTLDPPVLPTP